MPFKNILIGSILCFSLTPSSYSQCNKFTKKSCAPFLRPYLSNGQAHTTILKDNSKAIVNLSLNKGLNYRIALCKSEDDIGLEYELTNKYGKIFKSNQTNDNTEVLDFSVLESGIYELHLSLKNKNATKKEILSCVSVLIGFK